MAKPPRQHEPRKKAQPVIGRKPSIRRGRKRTEDVPKEIAHQPAGLTGAGPAPPAGNPDRGFEAIGAEPSSPVGAVHSVDLESPTTVTGTLAATGAATGVLTGSGALSATIAATSMATGTLSGTDKLSGTSEAKSTETAALTAVGSVSVEQEPQTLSATGRATLPPIQATGTVHQVAATLAGGAQFGAAAMTGAIQPPQPPAQAVGPHFEIGDTGVIVLAPPEALDRAGNHIRRLRALHPKLRDLSRELVQDLSAGNAPHARLLARVDEYRRIIDQGLDTIDFSLLYVEGVRLANAEKAAAAEISRGSCRRSTKWCASGWIHCSSCTALSCCQRSKA